MKNLLLIFASLFLLNCSTQNQEKDTSTSNETTDQSFNEPSRLVETVEHETQLRDSSFNSFLIEFSENEEFQLTRVDFPLNVKLIDIEDNEETVIIAKDEWQHEDLLDTATIETRDVDAYSQRTELIDSTATIKLRGIDNGIRIEYTFQLKEGRWYLTQIFNSST